MYTQSGTLHVMMHDPGIVRRGFWTSPPMVQTS